MDLKEIKAIIKLMHKEGVVSFKTPELELLINPNQPKRKRRLSSHPLAEPELVNDFKGYTDEEILMWSAPNAESNAE